MKIEISNEVAEILKKKVNKDQKFSSVEKYIQDILNQVCDRLKREDTEMSPEEQKKVEDRLREIGYLH